MVLLRLGVLVMMVVLGGIGVLLGAVTLHSGLTTGTISYSASERGRPTSTTVSRDTEPDRYWRLLGLLGALPLLAGAAAAGYAWRRLRS